MNDNPKLIGFCDYRFGILHPKLEVRNPSTTNLHKSKKLGGPPLQFFTQENIGNSEKKIKQRE